MKSKKFLIIFLSVCVAFIVLIIVLSSSQRKVIKYYNADVSVDSNGNLEITETVVVKYKSYENYYLHDISYGKYDYSKAPYNEYGSNLYRNDVADFEENNVLVEVYRGNIIDNPGEVIDITDQIDLGYSWKGDRYKTESGTYDVECSAESGSKCECISVDAIDSGHLVDEMTYVYRYTVYGVVTEFNDCAEINYKLLDSSNEIKIKKATVTFYLPHVIDDFDNYHAYGHGLSEGNIKLYDGDNKIEYKAKNITGDDEFECRLVIPKTIFPNINDTNKVSANLKNQIIAYEEELARLTNIQLIAITIVNILTFAIIGLMVFITIKVYKKYDKEFTPKFDKEYLRELPFDYTPAIMSYLYYFGRNNDEDITATLLDLIRRGYLELENHGDINDKDPDFTIKFVESKKAEMQSTLLPHEKKLISWFIGRIGDGEKVTISQIENYGKKYEQAQTFESDGVEFRRLIKQSGDTHDFFINTAKDKMVANAYGLIPLITGIIFFILQTFINAIFMWNLLALGFITIVYFIYVACIKKRSINGNEEYTMWKAFKHFLEDFGNFKDYPMPGIIVWEHFLVYATSFKIADKVMEQLKVKLPELPTEGSTFMSNRYYGGRNIYIFNTFNRVNSSVSRMRTNTINSIAAHNASKASGGGHGGGFSGGSSFGGGGGGFRGGR